jgi:hypothetical protein
MSKITTLVPHWIIVNWKTNSIFIKPFISLDEAKRNLVDLNINRLDEEWKIEQRETFQERDFDVGNDFGKY